MVQRVLILEDIAADAAVQIVSIFTALQDKAPEVFHLEKNKETSKGDIIRYVKKWNRFKELVGKYEKITLGISVSLREKLVKSSEQSEYMYNKKQSVWQ